MKRSFLRLIVSSVLVSWLIGLVVVVSYGRSLVWTEARARHDGVFLMHETLNGLPAEQRQARLSQLQRHTWVPLSIVTTEHVERQTGQRPVEGAQSYRPHGREHWFFIPFADGQGVLAAGPVNPSLPVGVIPIGVILIFLGLPVVVAFIALRVQREVVKVERASQALAGGELSVRVDNPRGPSNELAAEFNAMAERIERLVRSRDELVQAVSHELGSPLSRLRFHLELLERSRGEGRRERHQAMSRELDALDELVSELLSYVQSDDLPLARETFDPRSALEDLAELAVLDAQEQRDVSVRITLADEVTVHADPRLFLRTVENLLRNAVRHARTQVRLTAQCNHDHVEVAVQDDGPGVPPELRDKVTAPFFRLSEERNRETGGVGLGLAIVSRIVQRHGGQLRIGESALGGAEMITTWPRAQKHDR